MKNRIIWGSLALLVALSSSFAFAEPESISIQPQLIKVIPNDVFIPPGFDDNDNAQLIVSGLLPNTCYRAGSATARVDQATQRIYLQVTAYMYSGGGCAEVVVPYFHTVNLGLLPKGQFQVYVQDQNNHELSRGALNIVSARSSAPDDELYAPVEDVYVDRNGANGPSGQPDLVIRGNFVSDCMKIQDVKVMYRTPRVIEVLPILELTSGPACHRGGVPFESRVKLQSPWKGSTLIYVRSLNGQAITKIADL